MVKRILILTFTLLLQYATIIHAEPDPSPRGTTNAILAQLRVDLEQARNQTGVPGMSVAIMHKGRLIFAEGFGKRNDKDPFDPETVSMVGSLTKAFSAATVGELVAEGRLDWDTTPVNTFLPEFETNNPTLTSQITLQDLLAHRTNYPPLDFNWGWAKESRRDLIKRIRHVEVDPKMRAATNYNNVLFCVGAEAAANVAGVTIEQLVGDKVLAPLDLSSTGFWNEGLLKKQNHAVPYRAASFQDAVEGQFTELPLDGMVRTIAAAGDMFSTALDIARWGQIVMSGGVHNGNQVLNNDSVAMTRTAHTIFIPTARHPDLAPSVQYGMGWTIDSYKGNTLIEHGGNVDGYTAFLSTFPDAELVVALLSNADASVLPPNVVYHIADVVLGLTKTMDWLGKAVEDTKAAYAQKALMASGMFPPQIPNKPLTHELKAYTGTYDNPGYTTVTVELKDGELFMTASVVSGVLKHYHFDSFTTVLEYSSAYLPELVSFSTNSEGNVSAMQFSIYGVDVLFGRV
ncbi:hypothetical protein BGZ82_008627 [Podila clonocystis]|nr:hypothetical protein BGZ82_008627 [Podila clonocystis]